jgi:hypothetical protein
VDGAARRCIPILGGRVTGGITGLILAGGADWQSIAPSGALEIAARYVIEVEDGRIEVESAGLRHGPPEVLARLGRGEIVPASDYYFRTSMRFRTASPRHRRLNSILGVAQGERRPGWVALRVFEVT